MRAFAFSLAAFGVAFAAACDVAAVGNDVVATIPIDITGPRPTAQLKIGDNPPVTAIFDSAAAASVVRYEYASSISMPNLGPASAHGPGGQPMQGFRTRLVNSTLGGAAFNDATAVALNITLPLDGVDAIISPAVFSGRLVRYEFAESRVRIVPRTQAPAGEATPYHGDNTGHGARRVPGVYIDLPGAGRIHALADTGSAGSLLVPLDVARRMPIGELTPCERPIRMVGVEYRCFTTQVRGTVRVGPLTVQNPNIRVGENLGVTIVGMEILRNAVLVLDPQEHRGWVLAP